MADLRHKRDANARLRPRATVVAGTLAVLATASAVTVGIASSEPTATEVPVAASVSSSAGIAAELAERGSVVSRTSDRSLATAPVRQGVRLEKKSALDKMMAPAAVQAAVAGADTKLWTTADLNLWVSPAKKAGKSGVLGAEKKVLVTGRSLYGRDEVVVGGTSRWVSAGYLSDEKPVDEQESEPAAAAASSNATCSNGTSVPSGVSPNIVKVHEAVCAAFPEITTYGTLRSDGEHAQGIAVDIMVSGSRGWQVAEFVRANAGSLGVSYAIHARNIWSVQRSGEGWRGMADRGSTTANHYDHVHVTTY